MNGRDVYNRIARRFNPMIVSAPAVKPNVVKPVVVDAPEVDAPVVDAPKTTKKKKAAAEVTENTAE